MYNVFRVFLNLYGLYFVGLITDKIFTSFLLTSIQGAIVNESIIDCTQKSTKHHNTFLFKSIVLM